MDTTVNNLINGGAKKYEIQQDERREGVMHVERIEIIERPSFTDYLRSAWAINTSFAIDFTGSNGEIYELDSLHY